jgi:hypothetical protein
MARAMKQRGVSRSFPRRAGEASRCALQRLAPWKRSNRWYSQGLCRGCFNARAGQKKKGPQESNQWPLGSPEPGWTLQRLPIALYVLQVPMHWRMCIVCCHQAAMARLQMENPELAHAQMKFDAASKKKAAELEASLSTSHRSPPLCLTRASEIASAPPATRIIMGVWYMSILPPIGNNCR